MHLIQYIHNTCIAYYTYTTHALQILSCPYSSWTFKPSKEHFRGSTNQNCRQIGQGVLELWSDKLTDKQRLLDIPINIISLRFSWFRAVKLNPSMVTAWNELGESYTRKQDFPNAKICFEGALQHQKNKVEKRGARESGVLIFQNWEWGRKKETLLGRVSGTVF